jgi:hypothetical protein
VRSAKECSILVQNMDTVQTQIKFETGREVFRPAYIRLAVWGQILIFLAAFVLFVSRRPDAVLHAQFYAEDGRVWYQHAYEYGWRSLLIPDGGFLHSLSRLIALFGLLLPLAYVPLMMNLCGMMVQILPINLFLSSRFSAIDFRLRLACAVLYVGIPNSAEIDANTTTLQWHLALLAALVLMAKPSQSKLWSVFDFAVLILLSFEGPNGLLLIPMAALLWWKRRDAQSLARLVALGPGAIAQLIALHFGTRMVQPNGASIDRFIRILARRIFLSALVGGDNHGIHHMRRYLAGSTVVVVLGLGAIVYTFIRAQLEVKLFVLFGATVFAAALKSPLVGDYPQWEGAFQFATGCRYWFLPMLSFLAALIWIAAERRNPTWLRSAIMLVLLLTPIGIYKNWRYAPFADLHFATYVRQFNAAVPGTHVKIPINPPGWEMELVKR